MQQDLYDTPWSADCLGAPWWVETDTAGRMETLAGELIGRCHRTPDMPQLAKHVSHRFFVYGSLKKGFGAHYLLKDSKFIGRAWTESNNYCMRVTGSFPVVMWDYTKDRAIIQGEVYEVPVSDIPELDHLEQQGKLYHRKQVEVVTDLGEVLTCYWYLGNPHVFSNVQPKATLYKRKKTDEYYYSFTKKAK